VAACALDDVVVAVFIPVKMVASLNPALSPTYKANRLFFLAAIKIHGDPQPVSPAEPAAMMPPQSR